MTCVVLKFGGTSVGSIERIHHVARIILDYKKRFGNVVVVVSAMGGVTNQLVTLLQGVAPDNVGPSVAHDVVLSTGEQVTTGLLSLALERLGARARAFQGWQIPIQTDTHSSNADIININTVCLNKAFSDDVIPIVPGFQGITVDGDITTLGRGGSDTTAVALAGYLQASMCYIYTDVDGVFTADPRLVANARKHHKIPLDIMHVMAQMGSKVMHDRSIAHGMQHNIGITVLNSFNEQAKGTLIQGTSYNDNIVYGLAHSQKDVILCYTSKSSHSDDFSHVLEKKFSTIDLASLELIDGQELQFSCPNDQKTIEALDCFLNDFAFERCFTHHDVTKISIVGKGIEHDISFRNKIISFLEQQLISPVYVYAGSLRQTFFIPQDKTSQALQLLHTFLQLDDLEDIKEYA